MPKKKNKKEIIQVIEKFPLDGSFPVVQKARIKRVEKKKSGKNVREELENTRLDLIQ